MAVGDNTIIFLALLVLNYVLIWRHKNKNGDGFTGRLLGDIGFIILGIVGLLLSGVNFPTWLISIFAGIDLLLTISDA